MNGTPQISWAYSFIWAAPMIGAFLWAVWGNQLGYWSRLGIALLVQVVTLTVVHFLYD